MVALREEVISCYDTGGQLRIPQSEVTRLLGRYAPVEAYDPRKDPNALIVAIEDLQDDNDLIALKPPNFKQMMLDDKKKEQQQELATQLGLEYIETKAK